LKLPNGAWQPASITIAAGVEILLNCVWLVLGLSLVAAWAAHVWRTRSSKPDGPLPSRGLQVTAILLLVILLFPVISLTDDIAMCTAPRDAERALRLHDPFDGVQPAQALPLSTMAWMDAVADMFRKGPSRPVEQEAHVILQLAETQLPIESRPPPAAI
jgi:hypothetical protein